MDELLFGNAAAFAVDGKICEHLSLQEPAKSCGVCAGCDSWTEAFGKQGIVPVMTTVTMFSATVLRPLSRRQVQRDSKF